MLRMASFALVVVAGCGPDLTLTMRSEADVDPSIRRFLDGYQLAVKNVRRSGNDVQVRLHEEPGAGTLVFVRKGLDRLIAAEPTDAPLMLRITDDEPQDVALSYDPGRGGIGLYSVERGIGASSTLCVWEVVATNLPPMATGFEVRDDAPAELKDSLSGIADAINSVGLVREHEFNLGGEAFESGAERVEFDSDRVLFVFDEESNMGPPSTIGLPPSKFFTCMQTVIRRASDVFVAQVMFPVLSVEVASYSTE